MIKIIRNFLDRLLRKMVNSNYISRWIILCIDLFISAVSITFCYYLEVVLQPEKISFLPNLIVLLISSVAFSLVFFKGFKTHEGIIRFSSYHEAWRILLAVLFANITLLVVGVFAGYNHIAFFFLVFTNLTTLLILLVSFRFFIVWLFRFLALYNVSGNDQRGVVFGTDAESVALARSLITEDSNGTKLVGFITLDSSMSRTRILDLPVYYINSNARHIFEGYKINALIFANQTLLLEQEGRVVKDISNLNVKILLARSPKTWNKQLNKKNQLQKVQIEDLLGRDEIQISMTEICNQLKDKVVLVTGAAGSIGSEIVRQIATFHPQTIILFDSAETPLYTLQLEMDEKFPETHIVAVIGDVRSKNRVEFLFKKFHPQIIYHAAAYKHVPMMEKNPCEAILANVLGTRNIANFAIKFRAEKFVMISTDKAVNPSNVMGASKRIAEIYIHSLAKYLENKQINLKFITTRFGNVLGSNGSVIPRFKEQIENGGPVTVTHPDIIRYFMTIPEACRLVLEASAIGNNGEIYVFDMGKPVKIADLARKMIELAGFVPDKEILIEYTGLRNGEKLYEELLNDKEIVKPTLHEKIMVAKVRTYELREITKVVSELIALSNKVDIIATVTKMKELVPEFKSRNSIFETLDH